MNKSNTYMDMPMPFGKHKGELIAVLPNTYIDWLLDQEFFEEKYPKHWAMAKKEKEYRKKFDIVIGEVE